MKILYVTTIGGTMNFFVSFVRQLIDEGHTVDIATNENAAAVSACYREWGCAVHQIDTSRSPLSRGNLTAIRQLKALVAERRYDLVHCHTPVAAMCTRLACRKFRKKQGLKVLYTAHGFHFYKGAPLKNWLLYYPVERFCSRFTDRLITINQEDYALAKRKLHAKETFYVPGVGVDLQRFQQNTANREDKRRELGLPTDATVLTSVGELIPRKNHRVVLSALAEIGDETIHYVIVGKGELLPDLQALAAEKQIARRVHFLGYRTDVAEIYHASDVCVLPSIHEGLPVALMEAMACGMPVACSRIRGNVDLIDSSGGEFFDPHSIAECRVAIESVLSRDKEQMGICNLERVKEHATERIAQLMKTIYQI